jgi:hypothetical protein
MTQAVERETSAPAGAASAETASAGATSAGTTPATVAQALDQLTLLTANFSDGIVLRDVMQDWFDFLGGRPGQVVLVDNGSDDKTQQASFDCYRQGMIDKLLLVKADHCDTGRYINYIAEHTAPAIGTKPYLLFFKMDCLPWRKGFDQWLVEAMRYLERDDTFAIGGSFNCDAKHHEAWEGWYFADKCSENFALMKREKFIAAMEESMGGYISSGFRGPLFIQHEDERHYLMELAMERYMQKHGLFTLVRTETPDWTIFHTNVHNERLVKVRENYRARRDITRFMNAGNFRNKFPNGIWYGRPPLIPWHRRLRVALGESAIGPLWRSIKRSLGLSKVSA